MLRHVVLGLCVAVVASAAGCQGKGLFGSSNGNQPPSADTDIGLPGEAEVTASGLRRLTRDEFDNTLRDLLGETSKSGQKLPEDVTDPFDNDYRTQQVSPSLIETVETLATEASARALADPGKRDALVQCTPTGPNDEDCLRRFVTSFGRRALRRALTEDQVKKYLALQSAAVEANDFWVGVDLVIRAMLQDPEFLYRIEGGTAVAGKPGVFRLDQWELASRLSYFLWGSMPPDWLLDLAEKGELGTTAQVRAAAQRLLQDERARVRVDRFHALWLGYHQLPHPAELTEAMRHESAALVERIVFEQNADYFDLFRAEETFVNDLLAAQYGLPLPGSASGEWISYGASGRRGILSHGSVLSQGAKFSDTSPTQRGIWVRNRLLCQEIAPPPSNVNADLPPESTNGSNCKKDRYAAHANVGACKSCHESLDPIGWGLEQFDKSGRFRTHDDDNTACTVDGKGELLGVGPFNGPSELGDRLMESGQLEYCVATQVFRFAMGRRETPRDANLIDQLVTRWRGKNRSFQELLLAIVTDPTFAHRKEE